MASLVCSKCGAENKIEGFAGLNPCHLRNPPENHHFQEANTLAELKELKEQLNEKLDKNNHDINDLRNKLQIFEEDFQKCKSLFVKAGSTYELSVRNTLRNRPQYLAEGYKCKSLQKLSSVCLPAEVGFDKKKLAKKEQYDKIIGQRSNNLVNIALKQVDNLRQWLSNANSRLQSSSPPLDDNEKKNLIRKVSILKNKFSEYDQLLNEKDRALFLRDDPLGFYLFTSLLLIDKDKFGFVEEIEVDFAQPSRVIGNQICIYVGEMKSGTCDFKEATIQVVRRLGVLYMTALHALGDLQGNYVFSGIGELLSPLEWLDPTDDEIEEAKVQADIIQYPNDISITTERHNNSSLPIS